jgi:hypothetical protein
MAMKGRIDRRCYGCMLVFLVVLGCVPFAALAQAARGTMRSGVELWAEVGLHAVSFEERSAVFGPKLETEWESLGVALAAEAAYTWPRFPLRGQLGFTTFQSSTDTEKVRIDGQLTQTQDLDESFYLLTPALGYEVRLGRVRVTPLVGWEFQWIEQTRENSTEDIDANGPLLGIRVSADLTEALSVSLHYAHTFLSTLEAENSLFRALGFQPAESEGDIDRVSVGIEYHMAPPVSVGLSYQFLRNQRDESSVQVLNGSALVLPSAEHIVHAGFVRLTVRF